MSEESYTFGIKDVELTLGEAQTFEISGRGDVKIRVTRVTTNALEEGFVMLTSFKVGNVENFHGGPHDAYRWRSPNEEKWDCACVGPSEPQVHVCGYYTGKVPKSLPGFQKGGKFTFMISLTGTPTI